MASILWTTEGFSNGGSPDTHFRSYNNDTGVWTQYTGWPDAVINTVDSGKRQQGAWDGTYWYVIGSDGKLYRMNGNTQVWSAALAGGTALIPSGSFASHGWVMTSDARFIYLLLDSNDFRRYDPVADTLTVMSAIPNVSTLVSAVTFLAYDGVDTIYARGIDSGTSRQFLKYTISTNTWATIGTVTITNAGTWVGATCLQGKLWVLWYDNVSINIWQYNPANTTWTAKTTQLSGGLFGAIPYGEDSDGSIRVWRNGSITYTYNVGTDTWSTVAAAPIDFTTTNGFNWAITRLFAPAYTFFQADGVTALAPNFNEGLGVIGQTIQTQIKVKTPVDRGSGVTVAVVNNVQTDADDVVTISATAGGSYTTSFTTAALSANQLFDVFIRVTPSSLQTTGTTKNWNLRAT